MSRTSSPAAERTPRDFYAVGLFAAAFWGAGTNLLDPRWYVAHGLSIGDVVFAVWIGLAVLDARRRSMLAAAAAQVRQHVLLTAVFALLLLASVATNTFRFGAQWSDLAAILRFGYFSVLIAFTIAFVARFGARPLLLTFMAGIALLAAGRLWEAFLGGRPMIAGLPVLQDPNVIGNMMGIGIAIASLAALLGATRVSVVASLFFGAVSVLTFSKGAWLMVMLGLGSHLVALLLRHPLSPVGIRRAITGMVVFVALVGTIAYVNRETIVSVVTFKLQSTRDLDTINHRYRFAVAGLYAMTDYPLTGLGFRNYGMVSQLYPDVMPEPSENAHNAFVQVGAVAGIPALLVFMVLFMYPFVQLRRLLRGMGAGLRGDLYVLLSLAVFLASGAVQLQLLAQPFFWFYTGVVRGLRRQQVLAP